MKTCTLCKENKVLSDFNRQSGRNWLYRSECRLCQNRRRRANKMAKDPIKFKSRYKVRDAIKSGKLIRPDRCQSCREKGKIEAHHIDYNEPYNVKWLCYQCHRKLHGQKVKPKNYQEEPNQPKFQGEIK